MIPISSPFEEGDEYHPTGENLFNSAEHLGQGNGRSLYTLSESSFAREFYESSNAFPVPLVPMNAGAGERDFGENLVPMYSNLCPIPSSAHSFPSGTYDYSSSTYPSRLLGQQQTCHKTFNQQEQFHHPSAAPHMQSYLQEQFSGPSATHEDRKLSTIANSGGSNSLRSHLIYLPSLQIPQNTLSNQLLSKQLTSPISSLFFDQAPFSLGDKDERMQNIQLSRQMKNERKERAKAMKLAKAARLVQERVARVEFREEKNRQRRERELKRKQELSAWKSSGLAKKQIMESAVKRESLSLCNDQSSPVDMDSEDTSKDNNDKSKKSEMPFPKYSFLIRLCDVDSIARSNEIWRVDNHVLIQKFVGIPSHRPQARQFQATNKMAGYDLRADWRFFLINSKKIEVHESEITVFDYPDILILREAKQFAEYKNSEFKSVEMSEYQAKAEAFESARKKKNEERMKRKEERQQKAPGKGDEEGPEKRKAKSKRRKHKAARKEGDDIKVDVEPIDWYPADTTIPDSEWACKESLQTASTEVDENGASSPNGIHSNELVEEVVVIDGEFEMNGADAGDLPSSFGECA